MKLLASTAAEVAGPGLDLAVGDHVVYGSYGVGRVLLRRAGGTRRNRVEIVVLEFQGGLSVTLPLERAAVCLRPLSGEVELAAVQATLRSEGSEAEPSWQARTKAAKAKVVLGSAVALAEVIRDATRRERPPSARGENLSSYERELYLQARRLLAAEIGLSRGIDESQADAWIGVQLCSEPSLAAIS
jgi:RNA polymerase-interacting CarD/CdnL/TRCF family regulator